MSKVTGRMLMTTAEFWAQFWTQFLQTTVSLNHFILELTGYGRAAVKTPLEKYPRR
jgi:hypothetical protein